MSSSESEDVKGVRKRNKKNEELWDDEEDPENEVFGGVDLCLDESHDEESGEEAVEVKTHEEKSAKSKKTENDEKAKKKKIRKQVVLNHARLNGPTGLRLLKKSFTDFKFKGENHEKEDLTRIIKIMKHWMCYQLFPKYNFHDNIAQLEHLGNKKVVQVLLKKMRLGTDEWGEQTIITPQADDLFDEVLQENRDAEPHDNFNSWWKEQMILANSDSDREEKTETIETFQSSSQQNEVVREEKTETAASFRNNSLQNEAVSEERTKAAETLQNNSQQNEAVREKSSSSHTQTQITLTAEQLERIAKNKKLAEERRLQRLANEKSLNDSMVSITDHST